MKTLGIVTAFIAFIAFSATINGWALSILWEWYLVPIFNLPRISIPMAIGISLIAGYLTHQHQDQQNSESSFKEIMFKAIAIASMKPLFALLFGWIVLQWV